MHRSTKHLIYATIALSLVCTAVTRAESDGDEDDLPGIFRGTRVPSGQFISPEVVPGSRLELLNPGLSDAPDFVASGAMTTVLSPDQKTLLVLTSGYNLTNDASAKPIVDASQQYIFVYAIDRGRPVRKQVILVPNTFVGIAFAPDGHAFYVGGGQDDNIHVYVPGLNQLWAEDGKPIILGHKTGVALVPGLLPPSTAGVAVTADGSKLVVCNYYNDSVSVVDIARRTILKELDLRPGKNSPARSGEPGGEYPFWVAVRGNDTAYISSQRDRQIVVVSLGLDPAVRSYIELKGSPNRMLLNRAGGKLYVTEDFSDLIEVVDTVREKVVDSVLTTAPERVLRGDLRKYRGAIPNSLTLTPAEDRLIVTNGGTNSLAIVRLNEAGIRLESLIPTALYPTSVSVAGDQVFVVNGKSKTGPNPRETDNAANQYVLNLLKSSLQSYQLPPAPIRELLTLVTVENNWSQRNESWRDRLLVEQLRTHIKHVIYIVKENRTYDQILGDLDKGNGDASLTQFGEKVTPNFHALARNFVDLDNFYDPGDVSSNGWPWSTAARESDFGLKSVPVNYAGRGLSYDSEGTNRDVNVGLATLAERLAYNPVTALNPDPDILPGTADVTAPDAPGLSAPGKGYLWDAALRAGKTLRNYGFFCDLARYQTAAGSAMVPLEKYPQQKGLQVAFPTKAELIANFDPYFRGFDTAYPDFYREYEWEREFKEFVQSGELPVLSLVRLMEDHMGSFATALDRLNTPEKQQADNDYAVGKLIEAVAHSPYKHNTLIFVVEDDAQDGADHVDSHRSTAYIVGPYVKHNALVSKRFSTVNLIRTIEDVLGLEHLNLYTATARPMTEVFSLEQADWTFKAKPSGYLTGGNTDLPIAGTATVGVRPIQSTHPASYWADRTVGFDFSREDNLKDPGQFNRVIWEGLRGDVPYPIARSGRDLRKNRNWRLKHWRQAAAQPWSKASGS